MHSQSIGRVTREGQSVLTSQVWIITSAEACYFEVSTLPYKILPFFRVHVSEEGKDVVISVRAMKAHSEVEIYLHSFLASSVVGGEFSA